MGRNLYRSPRPAQTVSRAEAIAILYNLTSPKFEGGDLREWDLPRFPLPDNPERVLTEQFFDAAGDFSEGLVWVQKDGKVGFIDAKGELVVPLKFEQAQPFKENIDRAGKTVIEP